MMSGSGSVLPDGLSAALELCSPSRCGRVIILILYFVIFSVNGEPRLIVTPCEAIRRLAALHGALCEVVQRIDRSYGLPLVVILLSTLLHLIVTPYFLIMEISTCSVMLS